jgi:hypothetical protein
MKLERASLIFITQFNDLKLNTNIFSLEELSILNDISKAFEEGANISSVASLPHPILLFEDFYQKHFKNLFTRWSLLWLKKQECYKSESINSNLENIIGRYIEGLRGDYSEIGKLSNKKLIQLINLMKVFYSIDDFSYFIFFLFYDM